MTDGKVLKKQGKCFFKNRKNSIVNGFQVAAYEKTQRLKIVTLQEKKCTLNVNNYNRN